MKYLKEYYNYDNKVAEICKKWGIENWSIRDGLVDVDGDVDLIGFNLTKLPLKFGRVSGYFSCSNSKLTTLQGSPNEVVWFDCSYNQLTTLEGGPKEVDGDFGCNNNNLTTLEGAPKRVGGGFICSNNQLTTLEGGPSEVGGYFDCGANRLITLEGGPKEVGGWFDCGYNRLTTLEHFPRVEGNSNIYFSNNPLPKEIKDNRRYLKKIIEWQDEYDIWRDGKLYLPRFNDMMIDIKEGL